MSSNAVFPVTRKYKREPQSVVSGDYRIRTSLRYYFGTSYNTYSVYFKGEKLGKYGTQAEAKTAVEMHDAGFGTDVKYYNIPQKGSK